MLCGLSSLGSPAVEESIVCPCAQPIPEKGQIIELDWGLCNKDGDLWPAAYQRVQKSLIKCLNAYDLRLFVDCKVSPQENTAGDKCMWYHGKVEYGSV